MVPERSNNVGEYDAPKLKLKTPFSEAQKPA